MDSKLRTCSCCGVQYEYCPKCQKDVDKPTWYFAFCSSNCKNIYNVASDFEDNQIDAKEAKARLDKLDLSKLDNFGESYKNSIKKIVDATSVIQEVKVKTAENVQETVEPIQEEDVQPEELSNENVMEEKGIKKKGIEKSRSKRTKNVE